MLKDIYDPLKAYEEVFRDRFEKVARQTFAELAAEAKVDVTANQETCRKLHDKETELLSEKNRLSLWNFWRGALFVAIAIGIFQLFNPDADLDSSSALLLTLGLMGVGLYIFIGVSPRIKAIKENRNTLKDNIDALKAEAWEQMEPLNRLYDWDVLMRMMSQTVPRLEFDPYFTTQRLADMQATYGWDGAFNAERSVIYSHSGLINGNPFVICRTRKMEMGSMVYYGSKYIHWTTRERGSDGKYHTVQHSETLTASVTADFPEYHEKTRLIYGNTAAPDLIFHRQKSGLARQKNSLSYKWHRRSLRKKARNLEHADFAMLTNEDFEVAFDTRDRNNNQQYALLFTPLAQESMLRLLQDVKVGYGDDFDFSKERMINTIVSDHMQALDLEMNPKQYRNYEYAIAEKDFYQINARYFRAIYFCLAPLLCVPMYQQVRPQSEIYGKNLPPRSSFWEHEALANFWGQRHFKHPRCVTDCILKTEEQRDSDHHSTINVYAYGYRKEKQLTYVARYGGDGRYHNVPVYWDEYIPVMGRGSIEMQEDNAAPETNVSQEERMEHINTLLDASHLSVYRRHIASRT